MAATSGKRTRATLIEKGTVEEVNSFLQELPEKPKEDLSLKEAVEKLKDPLKDALSKGYNYDDLAKMLAGKGINISALTLKNYIPSGKRQRTAAAAKPRRTKKTQEETSSSELSGSSDQSESTPAATPRRGGRTKSSAMADTSATTSKPTRRKTTSTGAKPTASGRRKSSDPS